MDPSAQTSLHGNNASHEDVFHSPLKPTYNIPTSYQFQEKNIVNAQTSLFSEKAADTTANTFPLSQNPFGSFRKLANQPRIASKTMESSPASKPYNVPIGSERQASLNHKHAPIKAGTADEEAKSHRALDHLKRSDSASGSRPDVDSGPSEESELSERKEDEASAIDIVEQAPHAQGFHRFMRYVYIF